ncbi:transposase [Pseudoxanthomonas sp. 22568]|jgi:transposase|uniref:transposase n=1 Tax=Pseudoxanthomonas TaxID=83618 RepID=UPI00177B630E|nr:MULTISPECIES: transposase [Pseudoxanthomonas]MBD9378675.1 transposase [Pseudoxanthomonas sp. PXM04]UBB25457.1 transposase [Pseudoxanthomonas japonensis]
MLTENQESLDATISRLTQTQDASCSLSAVLEPQLSDDEWAHIVVNLGGRLGARARGHKSSARCFVEAVLWMAGSNDAYWRCLPIEYGANHSVYVRFSRWVKAGQWDPVLACLPESDARRQGLARMVATHRASLQRKQRYANHQAA